MLVVQKEDKSKMLFLQANIICYGDAADDFISKKIAREIEAVWNEPQASVKIKEAWYSLQFIIQGYYQPSLTPRDVYENDNPENNYFRIEQFAEGDISFVDGLGSNTGYFKLDNLLNESKTAAHEFGHTIGLHHPENLDIRNGNIPGIMYPRGTLVKPEFQYNPDAPAATVGGTLNPIHRKVLQKDIELLHLGKLVFTNDKAILGEFTSVWHDKYLPL